MQVIKLHDEAALLGNLKFETVSLIHSTIIVDAIKKLIEVYDIIDLNIEIEKRFKNIENPFWDAAALNELNKLRRELFLYHRTDFKPLKMFEQYNRSIVSFLNLVKLKNENLMNMLIC